MKKATHENGDMRDHYDFRDGVRGKYAKRYAEGTNVVVLDPDVARQWLFATATRPLASVEIDARVGGSFCLVDRGIGRVAEYRGTYVDIARPRRLAFTLVIDRHPKVVTRVGVEITPQRNGCELTLTHENVPLHDAVDIEGRWTGVLYGLDATLERSSRRLTLPGAKR